MSILSGVDLLNLARKRGQSAVPSFDVAGGNLDMLHAICGELAQQKACAFLASTPPSIEAYYGITHFLKTVREVSDEYDVAVTPHLDHATNAEDVEKALLAGCPSVMFDGSGLALEDNVELTRQIVAQAHARNATVEGELGVVGGKEEEVSADVIQVPSVDEALAFAASTGVDFFAPAVGTVHGFARGSVEIRWDLAEALSRACEVPLVLHGATDLDADTVRRFVQLGFSKVNFATGVRASFVLGLRESIVGANDSVRPQALLADARDSTRTFVRCVLDRLSPGGGSTSR
jgi:ketose-bisphosphate aldolase